MLPGEQLWFDLTIPTSDPLWCDDVSASFGWLGQVFVDAFADLGYRAQAHEGPSQHVDLGRICCFAGIGSGEVVIHGRKVVGLSQRRTREGARFQCLTYRRFAPQELLSALADEIDTQPLSAQLVDTVGVFGDTNLLFDTVVQHLDRLDFADAHVDDDWPASNQPVSAHSNG